MERKKLILSLNKEVVANLNDSGMANLQGGSGVTCLCIPETCVNTLCYTVCGIGRLCAYTECNCFPTTEC